MIMKKLLLLLLFTLLPIMANADERGTCGENLTWTYEETTKTLTISGNGAMDDFRDYNIPWYQHRKSITTVTIEDGVTSIGNWAFGYCDNLNTIIIPNSLLSIGTYSFWQCI